MGHLGLKSEFYVVYMFGPAQDTYYQKVFDSLSGKREVLGSIPETVKAKFPNIYIANDQQCIIETIQGFPMKNVSLSFVADFFKNKYQNTNSDEY